MGTIRTEHVQIVCEYHEIRGQFKYACIALIFHQSTLWATGIKQRSGYSYCSSTNSHCDKTNLLF